MKYDNRRNAPLADTSESGFVLITATMLLMLIFSMLAYVIDLGQIYDKSRQLNYATDAGALAAVKLLSPTVSDIEIEAEARAIAYANGLTSSNVLGVECGVWDPSQSAFTACDSTCIGAGCVCSSCQDGANAVRMASAISQTAAFAPFALSVNTLSTQSTTIALQVADETQYCIRPFGVEASLIGSLMPGDTFEVGRVAPGNWGKLDVGSGMNTDSNFEQGMSNGACDPNAVIGGTLNQVTGYSALESAFELSENNGTHNDMVFALTSDFANGQSGSVQVSEFVTVRFLHQSGSGNNWEATFELLQRDTIPPSMTVPRFPALVK